MAYRDFKDLPRRLTFDKILHEKAFNVVKNKKYDGYQRVLASMIYELFNKMSTSLERRSEALATRDKSVSSCVVKNKNM